MTLPYSSEASANGSGEISKPSDRGVTLSRPACRNMPSISEGVLFIKGSAFVDVIQWRARPSSD
jgi:hypothetical protein